MSAIMHDPYLKWPKPPSILNLYHERPAVDGRQKHKPEVAMHASTSVVFTLGRRRCTLTQLALSSLFDLHEIFKCEQA